MQHIILSGLPGSHVGLIAKRLAFLIGAPFVETITTGLPDKPPHVYSKEAFFYQQLRLQHALTSAMIVNHHRLTNPIAASLSARRELLLKTQRAADYLIVQEEGSVNTLAHNLLDLLHLKVLSPF